MIELRRGRLYWATYGTKYRLLTILLWWNDKIATVRQYGVRFHTWGEPMALALSKFKEEADLDHLLVRRALSYADKNILRTLVQLPKKKLVVRVLPTIPEPQDEQQDSLWQRFTKSYPNMTRREAARAQWVKMDQDDREAATLASESIASIIDQVPENMRGKQTSAAIFLKYRQWPTLFERKA